MDQPEARLEWLTAFIQASKHLVQDSWVLMRAEAGFSQAGDLFEALRDAETELTDQSAGRINSVVPARLGI